MIPKFQSPVSAEMIRDGGSLAFSFVVDGYSYMMFFQVLFDSMGRRAGYERPFVRNITLETEELISWDEASKWIRAGVSHLQQDGERKWAEAMLESCKLVGDLPNIMDNSPTELGRVLIGRESSETARTYEFHPFEMQHDWQKRRFLCEEDREFLTRLVTEKSLMLVGSDAFAFFEVAARFKLDSNGAIVGISRLALLCGEGFVETIK